MHAHETNKHFSVDYFLIAINDVSIAETYCYHFIAQAYTQVIHLNLVDLNFLVKLANVSIKTFNFIAKINVRCYSFSV